ncbi:MAG: VCBS repeat-containing protein [Anaerolineales bacterium]|nr:VCBS repeat-containing protein [Anaerolineales bacterium]
MLQKTRKNLTAATALVVALTGVYILTTRLSSTRAASWQERPLTASFGGAIGVHADDVDQDNDMDILGAAFDDDDIVWWENNGSQVFTPHTVKGDLDSAYFVNTADIDSDTDIDILGSGFYANTIMWWENDGDENFSGHTITDSFSCAASVYGVDIDDDTDIDILGAGQCADKIVWWENNGAEVFSEHTIASGYDGVYSAIPVDLDHDDDIDVLGTAFNIDRVTWWENDGNENFSPHTISSTFDGAESAYAVDVDGDTDIDVVGAAFNSGTIAWWENDGNEGFTYHSVNSSFTGASSIFAVDLDGDSDTDLMATSFSLDQVAWWENDGLENFTKQTLKTNFDGPEAIYSVDIDGDTDLDVLAAAHLDDKITWWEQVGVVQGGVEGQVVDENGDGLGSVSVSLDGIPQITTQTGGDYRFTHTTGVYTIAFDLNDYWSQSGEITITEGITEDASAMLISKSACLGESSSCALQLIGVIPVVGSVSEILGVGNDLCEIGQAYQQGNYLECAWMMFEFIAGATDIPVISQVLELQAGADLLACAEQALDAAVASFNELVNGIAEYLVSSGIHETIFLWGSSGTMIGAQSVTTGEAIDFTLTEGSGHVLAFSNGAVTQDSLTSAYGFATPEGYTVGIVKDATADYTLQFQGNASGVTDLVLFVPQSDGSSLQVTYSSITLTEELSATVPIISDSQDFDMLVDSDGNGEIDEILSPQSVTPLGIKSYLPVLMNNYFGDIRVDNSTGDSHQINPDMAIATNGTLYAVWEDYRHGAYPNAGDIYFSSSIDGGLSWRENVRVNDDVMGSAARRNPHIAVSTGGDVYVVWEDYRNDPNPTNPGATPENSQNPDIYLAKLLFGENQFQANQLVYSQGDIQIAPDVMVTTNGYVYVAWYDRTGDIFYGNVVVSKSTDNGASFNDPVIADNHNMWALDPRLAYHLSTNTIYLVYQGHPDYYKPYFTRSVDDGETWSSDYRLDAGANRDWYDAARQIRLVADNGGHIVVIWADERNDPSNCYSGSGCHDEFDIYNTYSWDSGVTWASDNVRVNDDSTYAWIVAPEITYRAADRSWIAVWRDSRRGDNQGDIYMAVSTDYGVSWGENRRVDDAPRGAAADKPVAVMGLGGKLYVLWQDYRHGNWDIYMQTVTLP